MQKRDRNGVKIAEYKKKKRLVSILGLGLVWAEAILLTARKL